MATPPFDSRLGALQNAIGFELRRIQRTCNAKNEHYETLPAPDVERLFVKLISDKERYFEAELAADRFLSAHSLPRIPIKQFGRLSDGSFWIAYPWIELGEFQPVEGSLRELAQLLGLIHRLSMGYQDPTIRRFAAPPDLARASIERVRSIDAKLASRLEAMFHRAMQWWEPSLAEDSCVLHGDFGYRNVARLPSGQAILFDYEHASIGPPILDFAKIWDRELSGHQTRRKFLEWYGHSAGVDVGGWERASVLVRLWAVAGIFPYAAEHWDDAFRIHGLTTMEHLERELY